MVEWEFIPSTTLPVEDYAPDVRVIDGYIHFTASRRDSNCPVYRTQDPASDTWELVSEPMPYWDPNIFQDDDGRVYLYQGCSNNAPLTVVEMDREGMQPLGEPIPVASADQQRVGWERFGEDNSTLDPPWMEGAWVDKHEGRYYLQYAAPGTQFNVYGDGVFLGEAPTGPFVRAEHNPFSLKPGGFLPGAGHGSSFRDQYGNCWHTSTMQISVLHGFERRLGLWPAGFDEDGVLFCNTRFGDFPMRMPQGPWDPWQDPVTGWMPLTYAKDATASGSLEGHPPALAVDESVRTSWAAPDREPGHWLRVDLRAPCTVHAAQINFAEVDCDQYGREGGPLRHRYLLEGSADGDVWTPIVDRREETRDVPHDYIELKQPASLRYVRLAILEIPGNGLPAVSGLRLFGRGAVPAPQPPQGLCVLRDPADPCVARLRWEPCENATGYNVRWGIAPQKLYSDWLLYGASELKLPCLTADQGYHVAVEAFGEGGVSPLSTVISI
jgi:hypothetical protein